MSTIFPTRRRADRFEALLAHPAGVEDTRYGDLLDLTARLETLPAPEPRAAFSVALREQLLVEAETVLLPQDHRADDRLRVPARTARIARSPRERRLAVAAGALAMVGATTSMAVAAQTALPGDTLYPVKRALEDVHAGVSMGDAARGSTLLANASGRLDEVTELAAIGSEESLAGAPDALRDFVDQAEEGSALLIADYRETGDPESIAKVRDFAGQSLGVLAALEGQLPQSADDAMLDGAEALAVIDAEAADLCATCGGLGIAELPPSLVAGIPGDGAGVAAQPVQPGQPLQPMQPRGPAAGSSGGAGSGSAGSGGQGDGSPGRDEQLPGVGGALPPGSVTGDGGSGSGSGPVEDLTDDVTEKLTGSRPSSAGGSDQLLQPLKQTTRQIDDLIRGLTGTDPAGSGTQGSGSRGSEQGSGARGPGKQGSKGGAGEGDDLLGGLLGD